MLSLRLYKPSNNSKENVTVVTNFNYNSLVYKYKKFRLIFLKDQ